MVQATRCPDCSSYVSRDIYFGRFGKRNNVPLWVCPNCGVVHEDYRWFKYVSQQEANAIIEREQSKGHFEPELDTAISVALHALQEPREMCCGGCQRFGDEDANGVGWCEEHDREAYCDEPPCGYFE